MNWAQIGEQWVSTSHSSSVLVGFKDKEPYTARYVLQYVDHLVVREAVQFGAIDCQQNVALSQAAINGGGSLVKDLPHTDGQISVDASETTDNAETESVGAFFKYNFFGSIAKEEIGKMVSNA